MMNLIAARSVIYSLLLHSFAFALLLISLDNVPRLVQPAGTVTEIINAVAVDSKQVEQELNRLKETEQQRRDEQARQQEELERIRKESQAAEERRKQEELRLAELKKKQTEDERRRREEEEKLAEARKKQADLERQQAELEDKRRQEETARAEAEQKRREEEAQKQKQAEEERRRQEEAAILAAEQDRRDQTIIGQYVGRIQAAITREFNTSGLPAGLSCILQIRMSPGGDVVQATIVKSSGNAVFDSRAETAVQRASPLPVPDDQRIFAKMREIRLTFAPD